MAEAELRMRSIIDAGEKLKSSQRAGGWVLMAPNGDVWIGSPRDMVSALIAKAGIAALLYPQRTDDPNDIK